MPPPPFPAHFRHPRSATTGNVRPATGIVNWLCRPPVTKYGAALRTPTIVMDPRTPAGGDSIKLTGGGE
jgi:hypothetical protein